MTVVTTNGLIDEFSPATRFQRTTATMSTAG